MNKQERHRRILTLIANDLKIVDIAETLGVHRVTVQKDLRAMLDSKLLEKKGYQLTKKAKDLLEA